MIRSVLRLAFVLAGWSFLMPILADAAVCGVTAGFEDSRIQVSGLLVDVRFDASTHEPMGAGEDVECVGHVPGSLATFNQLVEEDVVKAGLVRLESFGGPSLFSCVFEGDPLSVDDIVFLRWLEWVVRKNDRISITLTSEFN